MTTVYGNIPLTHPDPRVREALLSVLACVEAGTTGSLEIHFKEGIPQRRHWTDVQYFKEHS